MRPGMKPGREQPKIMHPVAIPASSIYPARGFALHLPDLREGYISVPAKMSRSDFDLVKRQIAEALEVMEAVTKFAEPPAEEKT